MVIEGEVFISRMHEEGKELVTSLLVQDGIFGATSLFCGIKEHTTYARAKTDCVIQSFERESFEMKILSDQALMAEWMQWLDIDGSRQATKLRDLSMYGKSGALASILIRLCNSFGTKTGQGITITTQLTNQNLAAMCGTSREGINRMMTELKQEGILSIDRKQITVHDIIALKKQVNCENCSLDICQIF
ncbi:cAMP-activated global transcriptional regulator CRP [Salinicoccus sesuvii]